MKNVLSVPSAFKSFLMDSFTPLRGQSTVSIAFKSCLPLAAESVKNLLLVESSRPWIITGIQNALPAKFVTPRLLMLVLSKMLAGLCADPVTTEKRPWEWENTFVINATLQLMMSRCASKAIRTTHIISIVKDVELSSPQKPESYEENSSVFLAMTSKVFLFVGHADDRLRRELSLPWVNNGMLNILSVLSVKNLS